jgi:uncharacterized protein YodC (DUF2158 family)
MSDSDIATEQQFTVGDTVVLLSGGPLMTVSEARTASAVCIWFAADETLCTAEIPFACIEAQGPLDFMLNEDDDFANEEPAPKKKKKKKKFV